MKKYILQILMATLAVFGVQADGFRPQILLTENESAPIDALQTDIVKTREQLNKLTKNNELVLQRYDQFVLLVETLYRQEHRLNESQACQLFEALLFAAQKHQGQTRKNKELTPYISHPIGVTNNLMLVGNVSDPEILMASLLHDTLEDTQTTFDEIKKNFGKEVASYVQEVTDDKNLSKEEHKRAQVINASHKSKGAAQIKYADYLYNLTDLLNNTPTDWTQSRIDLYFEWTEAVVNRLPNANPELKQAVDQLINQYWENQKRK